MITLSDILLPEDILLDLEVGSAAALFDEVGQNMQRWHGLPRVQVAAALGQREHFGSTALGQGVAIPHGRLAGLRQTHAAYVRPRRPMPFDAPDGKPVSDFIVLLVPERATEEHLGILAGVSALFTDPRFRTALHACDDPHGVRACSVPGCRPQRDAHGCDPWHGGQPGVARPGGRGHRPQRAIPRSFTAWR